MTKNSDQTQMRELIEQNNELRARLSAMENSLSWHVTKPFRTFSSPFVAFASKFKISRRIWGIFSTIQRLGGVRNSIKTAYYLAKEAGLRAVLVTLMASISQGEPNVKVSYAEWADKFLWRARKSYRIPSRPAYGRTNFPLISVILPTFNSKVSLLDAAVRSVIKQTFPNWELIIVDDASTKKSTVAYLKKIASADSRIRVVFRDRNGHISAATNDGISLAKGAFTTFLDHDDLLTGHALQTVQKYIEANPKTKFAYSDEDKITARGIRTEPHFKPNIDRTLALSYNYFCHLSVYDTQLLRDLGGTRSEFDGAQDYDLALRMLEVVSDDEIIHIPEVLYHWRITSNSTSSGNTAKPYVESAGRRAVQAFLKSSRVDGQVIPNPELPMYNRVLFPVQSEPLVSIIIPTRDHVKVLTTCINSIYRKTKYKNFEVIVVDNDSVEVKSHKYFEQLKMQGVRVVATPGPFNYSRINNLAVQQARGDFICLMNNDIEVESPDWLSEMLSQAQRPGIAAVGARLWYPNGQLQHGGVVLGLGGVAGVAGHAHKYLNRDSPGYMGRAKVAQEFSAVTAACLLVRKSTYLEVGGLTEELQVAFNDVDLCLKFLARGYKNVWTPFAELTHHESLSRGSDTTREQVIRAAKEVVYMRRQWGPFLDDDPSYNRHLTRNHEDFSLAWPPRKAKPVSSL